MARTAHTVVIAIAVAALLALPGPASGQNGRPARLTGELSIATTFDNNVFLLAPGRKDILDAPPIGTQASGRFTDMMSPTDVVTAIEADLGIRLDGLTGRRLTLAGQVEYDHYQTNTERSRLTVGASLEQNMPNGGRFRLRAETTPRTFRKNYLIDVSDANGDGIIDPAERIYAAGPYRESEVSADYRFRIVKATRRRPLGIALRVGGGYVTRAYEDAALGRDRRGPQAGADLSVDLGAAVELTAGYAFRSLTSTPSAQALVLDEPDFGEDFNGDGDAADDDIGVTRTVDRSRRDHRLETELRVRLARGADLGAHYEYRWRQFTSADPSDVVYFGKSDRRSSIGGDITLRVLRALRLRFEAEFESQDLAAGGSQALLGDIEDYQRFRTGAALIFRF